MPLRFDSQRGQRAARLLVVASLCFALLGLVLACAWQSDDAYITFRTIRNVISGHGLTWNPGERVQAFTHPLWMALLLPWHAAVGEIYYGAIGLSLALTLISVLQLVRSCRGQLGLAFPCLLLLSTSAAFIDFATSGLENPLLYLLMMLLLGVVSRPSSPRQVLLASLLVSGIALTRLDSLLIAVPPLLALAWELKPRRRALGILLVGMSPWLAWEVTSLIYYGSFLPNTALAKLNLELSPGVLVRQGALYFWDSLAHDPVTLATVALVIAFGLWRGPTVVRAFAIGLLLDLAYVARIGGDFMSGRFFSVPFVVAVGLLAPLSSSVRARPQRIALMGLTLALVGYGLLWPESRWSGRADATPGHEATIRPSGIADERAFYHPVTGLVPVLGNRDEIAQRGLPTPPHGGAIVGQKFARAPEHSTLRMEVGFFGYFAGDQKVIVDAMGLADPLLARIPFRPTAGWRIGHFSRRIPAGYLETRETGRNRIADPGLAHVYDGLTLITRGPLFSVERWREIWRFHTGYYASALGNPDYL